MKWLSENIVSLLALGVSLVALWQSHRTSSLSTNLNRSKLLSEIYDRIRPGRRAMQTIWDGWATSGKTISSLTQNDREKFQNYYNANFHNAPSGSAARDLSADIFLLMHELDRIVGRIARGEFTKTEVMQMFGYAIAMDQHMIRIYLEAHWREHEELKKPLEERFWSHVLSIVDDAEIWQARSRRIT